MPSLWGSTYLSFSDIVGTSCTRSQPVLLLILSAWKWNSRKFKVASDSSTQRQLLDNRPCCTPLGRKHPDLVAVVAPFCIKGLRLVTVQLLEKFSPIRPGANQTSPSRSSTKLVKGHPYQLGPLSSD